MKKQSYELDDGIGSKCGEEAGTSKSSGGMLIVEPETVNFFDLMLPFFSVGSVDFKHATCASSLLPTESTLPGPFSLKWIKFGHDCWHNSAWTFSGLKSVNDFFYFIHFKIALLEQPNELSGDWLFRLYRKRFLPKICLDLVAMQCSLERFEEELRLYLDNIAQWIRVYFNWLKSNKIIKGSCIFETSRTFIQKTSNCTNSANEWGPKWSNHTIFLHSNSWHRGECLDTNNWC